MSHVPDPSPVPPARSDPPAWRGWAMLILAAAATFGLGLMAANIQTRRDEAARQPALTPIDPDEMDAAKWGQNFPRQYDSYLRMADSSSATKTKYGGATQRDYLEQSPANVIIFGGYAFGKDYRQARGHVHAIEDILHTGRMQVELPDHTLKLDTSKPATCWTCKSPDVPRMMKKIGVKEFYAGKFGDLVKEITHPIGCYDCHDPASMALRITRPALVEAFQRQGRDITKASHQEMRSLVCAQCHVTYYFKTQGNYLTFPWDKGASPEKMEEYYDEVAFSDYTNKISQVETVKLRHPDFELYSTGIHAYRNVACADCHMPYRTEGGVKFTDHHLQSPLHNIAASCAVCHRWSEEEIRSRVESTQDKVFEARGRTESALSLAHFDIAAAAQAGAPKDELSGVRKQVRHAQMRWDYVAASNGMGIHSPAESLRILAGSLDLASQARTECARILARHGVTDPVRYPDISTKEKAQAVSKEFAAGHPPKLVDGKEKGAP